MQAVDAYSSVNAGMREHNRANNRVGVYVKICDWPPPAPEPPAPISPPPRPRAPNQPPHAPLSPPLPPVYQCYSSSTGAEYDGDIRHTEGGHQCAHTRMSCSTAIKKSRIVTLGFLTGKSLTPPFATPISIYTIAARTEGYTYAAKVWDLSIVQRPFPVAPCQTYPCVTIRNFCIALRAHCR